MTFSFSALISATVLLTFASSSLAQQRFDLICEGEVRYDFAIEAAPRVESWEAHYRIDLDRRVWCGATCTSVNPLGVVTATRIELAFEPLPYPMDPVVIDRTTGRTTSFMRMGDNTASREAICRRATYSGIPEAKF
tara:strand:+ start:425 stop:832 length:408 start_codon:yes stop_codon:yes gene_type:complete